MRLFIIALLFAISYAQTDKVFQLGDYEPGSEGLCGEIELPTSCTILDNMLTSLDYVNEPCPSTHVRCIGDWFQKWETKNKEMLQSTCDEVQVKYTASQSHCDTMLDACAKGVLSGCEPEVWHNEIGDLCEEYEFSNSCTRASQVMNMGASYKKGPCSSEKVRCEGDFAEAGESRQAEKYSSWWDCSIEVRHFDLSSHCDDIRDLCADGSQGCGSDDIESKVFQLGQYEPGSEGLCGEIELPTSCTMLDKILTSANYVNEPCPSTHVRCIGAWFQNWETKNKQMLQSTCDEVQLKYTASQSHCDTMLDACAKGLLPGCEPEAQPEVWHNEIGDLCEEYEFSNSCTKASQVMNMGASYKMGPCSSEKVQCEGDFAEALESRQAEKYSSWWDCSIEVRHMNFPSRCDNIRDLCADGSPGCGSDNTEAASVAKNSESEVARMINENNKLKQANEALKKALKTLNN